MDYWLEDEDQWALSVWHGYQNLSNACHRDNIQLITGSHATESSLDDVISTERPVSASLISCGAYTLITREQAAEQPFFADKQLRLHSIISSISSWAH